MQNHDEHGFTLLEMMVVIAIIALLSLGGWGSWQQWQQRQQLNDTARQIQHLLLRVRSDANWHNSTQLLWLKPGPRWCLGSGKEVAECSGAAPRYLLAPFQGVSVTTYTAGMGFYGRKNSARPGRIVIAGQAGERRIIVSARGRVRICAQSEEACR